MLALVVPYSGGCYGDLLFMDGAVVLWLSPWSFAGLQCDERFACNSE